VSNTPTPEIKEADFVTELFSVSGWLMFLLAVVAGFLNLYLLQEFVLTDEVYHNSLGERLAYDRIEKMLDGQRTYFWVAYAFIPVGVLLQVLAISICLMTGVVISFAKVGFKQIFRTTLTVVAIITVLRLLPTLVLLFQDVSVLDDLLDTDWYSLLALFGRDHVVGWLQVPLTALNIFHLLLVVGLVVGMHYLSSKTTVWIALVCYAGGTLLWWVCLMYLQVSFG
jgi:hypothetical protein